MTTFTRVDKTNVADTVIDQITALIRSGALKPGDRLPTEHGLSRQLGVGRSSVREALKALEVLGLVRRGQDGSFISEESSSLAMSKVLYTDLMARQLDIVHLYEARQFLETHLGALATENLSEDDFGELRSLCEAMEATPDRDIRAHVKLDRTFHGTLCELAGNPVLTRLWELCFSVLVEIRQGIPFTAQDIRHSDERHRALLDALSGRDPQRVRDVITDTLTIGRQRLVARLAEQQDRQG